MAGACQGSGRSNCVGSSKEEQLSSIYSFSNGKYFLMSVTADGDSITAYDYAESCHTNGALPSLYHYGVGSHTSLNGEGDRYNGYDYDTGSHFTVTINGGSVQMYDCDQSAHFKYSG
jgi:hypothetical protein